MVLNCTVRNPGEKVPKIRWFVGNRQLNNGPEFSIYPNGSLIRNNVSLSNEAEYLCRAELGTTRLELIVNVMVTSEL